MTIYEQNLRAALRGAEQTMLDLSQFAESSTQLEDFELDDLYKMSAELWAVVAQLEAYVASRSGTMDTA